MTDIHIHTKYSLLDAIIEPEELVKKCKEQGKKALCVTEHGNLYSDVEVYKLCQKYGIKYLMGVEAYICDNANERNKLSKYHHLLLIAKNERGRLNLIQLVSLSCKYKYYKKPRIDYEMLSKYKEGLICCSACMAGEIQRNLIEHYDIAKSIALKYQREFGDDYYLEYQSHSDTVQQQLNALVVKLAKEIHCKFIVTTDAHYLNREEQKYHSVFVGIGTTREVGETYSDCYIQSQEEILSLCKSTSKADNLMAISNTDEIADKCNVQIPLSAPILPHDAVPAEYKSEIDFLKHLCAKGWQTRGIKNNPVEVVNQYKERLIYELTAIKKMGFEGYYRIVWSYANSVKRRGIARGSGGGSLVAYLINIVDTDPVKYGLYFERFIDVGALQLLEDGAITKDQLKLPDFDLDFGKQDREKVLEFVVSRYGEDKVVSLGSFQYIWAKGAIKDIGKVLNIPFNIRNEMTANLRNETIQEALELGLLNAYKETYSELFEYASKIAGLPKSFSMHPCGKVIANNPILYYNAVDYNDDGSVILQGDMHTAEDLGLVKADFLGLRTVDIIYDVLDLIGKDYQYIAPHAHDFNDKRVFENFRNGYTDGIFQFESQGMRSVLKNIECNSLYDLTVANALYRPGAIKYIDNYAARRRGEEEYSFLHNDLKPILKDSYGIIIFQEQLIEIGKLAKLSNPDELRKATAKKKPELLAKIKPEFFNGLSNRGWAPSQIEELWEIMLDFANYSFNKSHALAYAMMAYICMYLKTYHSKEFICAWINNYHGDTKKISTCIAEARRMGVTIYPASFSRSCGTAYVYNDGVQMGTESIKDCNKELGVQLRELNNEKPESFIDVLRHYPGNNHTLDVLINLDFFLEYGDSSKLLKEKEVYNSYGNAKTIKKDKCAIPENTILRFAVATDKQYRITDNVGLVRYLCENISECRMSAIEKAKWEINYLGYVSTLYENMSKIAIVSEVNTDRGCSLVVHTLNDGRRQMWYVDSNLYMEHPIQVWDVIEYTTRSKPKHRKVNEQWVQMNEDKQVLSSWAILN